MDFILQELNIHNSQPIPEVLTTKGIPENHKLLQTQTQTTMTNPSREKTP
jgi:hypothetical protein